jgi:hypothetical protein
MNSRAQWLFDLGTTSSTRVVDGLVPVHGYEDAGLQPEVFATMEKARAYSAQYVFFEASRNDRPPVAQAFVFVSDGPAADQEFGELHRRLWNWGGVPMLYRKTPGLVQLFRCAHKPDFLSPKGDIICNPVKELKLAAAIAAQEATESQDLWWDATPLRNGTLWDDPDVCRVMLSASKAAHKRLVEAVEQLYRDLNQQGILKQHLRRRLLILSLLIAYLEQRGAFPQDYFSRFKKGATRFFEVVKDGKALVALLKNLEERFNGNVFAFHDSDHALLEDSSNSLRRFATFVEAYEEPGGQLNFWQIYSFRDLPVELISHIYQLFVGDSDTAVYTPPFLARMMLEEALSWERLDRLEEADEIILDPSCGSGVFLVEAYKRLVLHWRIRHKWNRPRIPDLKRLLKRVHGVDLEEGAIDLSAFSLCLALCDALEPEEIRASIRLFPVLAGHSLHHCCFFEAKEKQLVKARVGVIVGNPPFKSKLATPGAQRSYERYQNTHGSLPDKQVGYLFLHEAMELLASGGILSMLQQYNFLYNQKSLPFRRRFVATWDVREILDLISVRGLFRGAADTKVLVVVANATPPESGRKILHAVFRRSGRIDTEQGFDIDYYDLHWLPRQLVLAEDSIWRANMLGGGRILGLVERLKQFRTLQQYAEERGWHFGEGFVEGRAGKSRRAEHIIGKAYLPSEALTSEEVDASQIIDKFPMKPIEGPRTKELFTPPMLLVREQMDLPHALWSKSYLTYKNQIVGFAAPRAQHSELSAVSRFLTKEAAALRAYVAIISAKMLTQKATTLTAADILALPYPETGSLELSANEEILADDIVTYQREFVRYGEHAAAMRKAEAADLAAFATVFSTQINTIYGRSKSLRALPLQTWPGAICQPFVFGSGNVDWEGADQLQDKLNVLFQEKHGTTLQVTRIARVYENSFIFLLKPNRLRYWLRSVALRDADDTLADLRAQGY